MSRRRNNETDTTSVGARGRKVSRRRNNETDTTSVGAHGKKREEVQKAYTFGAHDGTKKLLLAARSWRTNKAPSQPALQQHKKMSMIALHCVPKNKPCFSVSARDPVLCVRKRTFRSVSFKKVLRLIVDVLFGIIPRVDFDCFSTSPDHLSRVPSRIFFAISCGGSKRLVTRLNRRKQSTVDGRGRHYAGGCWLVLDFLTVCSSR